MRRWMAMAALVLGSAAQAGEEREPDVRYKEITEVEFEAVDVDARAAKPAIRLVDTRTGARFTSLVRPRVEFDREIRASVDEIK